MDPRHLRIEAYFTSDSDYNQESLRNALIEAGVDGVWLRMAAVTAAANGGAALGFLCAEVTEFGSDDPVADISTLRSLSDGGRLAFFLSFAGDDDRVLYEVYRDGARVGGWEGIRREYPATVEPDAGAPGADDTEAREDAARRAFNLLFRSHTGVDFESILGSDAAWPILDHGSRPGTEAFFLNRRLRVSPGTSKMLDLFRFRDRGGDDPGDHLAFVVLDLEAAKKVLTMAPAGHLAELLGRLDEGASFRLGPFSHAIPAVAVEAAAMPEDRPAAEAGPSVDLVELVTMANAAGTTAGDAVRYFESVFFPLLSLYDLDQLPPLDAEELAALTSLDTLEAMAEVVPYNAPEGQLLESFADDEIRPLAPTFATNGEYSGSLFLLDRTRLRGLLDSFEGTRLAERLEQFLSAWWHAENPEASDDRYAAWRRARAEVDRSEVERFALTLAELRAVVGLCDENDLELAVVFYEA